MVAKGKQEAKVFLNMVFFIIFLFLLFIPLTILFFVYIKLLNMEYIILYGSLLLVVIVVFILIIFLWFKKNKPITLSILDKQQSTSFGVRGIIIIIEGIILAVNYLRRGELFWFLVSFF